MTVRHYIKEVSGCKKLVVDYQRVKIVVMMTVRHYIKEVSGCKKLFVDYQRV